MTRRNKPKNSTIVKEALKVEVIDPATCYFDINKIEDRMVELGCLEDAESEVLESKFIFPNDLDLIQPIQKEGNLCIQFPE